MEEIGEFVLKQCHEAQYAEVRVENHEGEGFLLKNGIPEIAGFDSSRGIGVRVLVNGAMAFASTNILDKEHITAVCQRALKLARHSAPLLKKPITLSDEKAFVAQYRVPEKKKIADTSHEDKLAVLHRLHKDIQDSKVPVSASYLTLHHNQVEKYFMNSEGARIHSYIPRLNCFWFATVAHNSKSLQKYQLYYGTGGFELLDEWDVNGDVVRQITALDAALKTGKKARPGVYDVICGQEITGIASHESVGHPFEADRILGRESAQAGESFVKPSMVGAPYCSENITLHEDPGISQSAGYYQYDDEGVKARDRILIKKGAVNEFLHNRDTASQLGVHSNGSMRASSYHNEPLIRMANSYVAAGDSSEEEIIAETKNGIYMKSFMEWNIDDKRFNQKYVGSEAYLVENGKILHPVLNPVLEITTPEFWKSVDLVANVIKMFAGPCGKGEPMQTAPVLMGGPVIRLKNIRVQ